MTEQATIAALGRRDKAWRQCIERVFGAYSDVFTLLAPTVTHNTDAESIPNMIVDGHLPGDPRVKTTITIPFVEFMGNDRLGGDRANWDELADRHAQAFLKKLKKSRGDQAKLDQARANEHLP